MKIDDAFLRILRCPATGRALVALDAARLSALNRAIAAGTVRTGTGNVVSAPLDAALATDDGSRIYPVVDGIPVLLIEEAVVVRDGP